ncbi:hypothetical protein [Lentzea flava]|uniref:Lsr2 protein n=1 Tax=Lentzea flava TaxID=103732 RepID=A0ABQ2UL62_9PSEU|nr:hypothetical protein [Lentzea flava]MCP2200240.1 hypothetical protein [Lentzea flava]GGU40914.1 hypothetical protein GCM10010178_36810 [Lentzea flava]
MGIAEEDVQRYQEIAARNHLAATRVIEYRHLAIVAEGHPVDDPLTMVRQWNEGGEVKEERLDGDLRRVPADLLRQHGDQAVPVDVDAVRKHEGTLAKRYREKHGF